MSIPLHDSVIAAAMEIVENDPGDGEGNLSEEGQLALDHLKSLAGDPDALRELTGEDSAQLAIEPKEVDAASMSAEAPQALHGVTLTTDQFITNPDGSIRIPASAPSFQSGEGSLPATMGRYKIVTVCAADLRGKSPEAEEFGDFGTRAEFPDMIGENEIWIADTAGPERRFWIDAGIAQLQALENGASPEEAYEAGLRKEAAERERATGGKDAAATHGTIRKTPWRELADNTKIMLVDGAQVRDQFKTDWSQGGHSEVYPWIPRDEVWIDADMHPRERPYLLLHELLERQLMRGGMNYDRAHEIASHAELAQRHAEVPGGAAVLAHVAGRDVELTPAELEEHQRNRAWMEANDAALRGEDADWEFVDPVLRKYLEAEGVIELSWTPHKGARGGQGWKSTATGDIRYQKNAPKEREGAQKKPPTGKKSAKTAEATVPKTPKPPAAPKSPSAEKPQTTEMPNATITIEPPGATAAASKPAQPTPPAAPKPQATPKTPPAPGTIGHIVGKYKSQMRDATFAPGLPAVRTVASTKDNPLSAAEHKIVGQAHAIAGAAYKKQGRKDMAQANFAAARYHNEAAQKKTTPKTATSPSVDHAANIARKQAAHDSAHKEMDDAVKKHIDASTKEGAAWAAYDDATGDARTALRTPMQSAAKEARDLQPAREASENKYKIAAGELREAEVDRDMASAEAKGTHLTVDRAMQAAKEQGIDQPTQAKYHKTLTHVTARMPKQASRLLNMGLRGGFNFYEHADDVTVEADRLTGTNSFVAQPGAPYGYRTNGFFRKGDGSLHLNGDSGAPPQSSLMGAEEAMTGTFSHELTHSIDNGNKARTGKAFSDDPEWIAAHRSEAKKLSDYAATELVESFAEFGRLVYGSVVDKDKVKEVCPLGYAFFKKHGLIDW